MIEAFLCKERHIAGVPALFLALPSSLGDCDGPCVCKAWLNRVCVRADGCASCGSLDCNRG